MHKIETADDGAGNDGQTACWVAEVRAQLRVLAGQWVEEADTVWEEFARTGLVRILVHGAYDAGKSSLLKRFLVEDGTPVPEWLVVGARPTTNDLGEIDSGGVTWIDSPGLAAGNARHDGVAEQALALTDGLLVVLPPQLLGGDTGHLPGLLDGSFFNPFARRALFPPGAVIVAVAQMDTAGVSADDDLEGYQELVQRKREELDAIFRRAGVVLPAEFMHLVAADPGQAAMSENPSLDDFAGHEAWDGVAGLRTSLRSLAARRAELRTAAAVRYWCLLGSKAHANAETERRHLEMVLDAARREHQATDLVLVELRSLDEAARSQLHDLLRSALRGMTLAAADRDHVEQQLDATIDAWLVQWGGKLERFAQTAAVDRQLRADRPGSAALRHYVNDLLGDMAAGPANDPEPSLRTLLGRFGEHATTLANGAFTLIQGRTPEEAKAELERVRRMIAQPPATTVPAQDGLPTGALQADAIQRSLRRLATVETLLPIVLELGGYVVDRRAEAKSEQRRIELRELLRDHADRIARHVLDDGSDVRTWSNAVAEVRAAVRSRSTPSEVVTTAEQRLLVADGAMSALADLLAEVPFEKADRDRGLSCTTR